MKLKKKISLLCQITREKSKVQFKFTYKQYDYFILDENLTFVKYYHLSKKNCLLVVSFINSNFSELQIISLIKLSNCKLTYIYFLFFKCFQFRKMFSIQIFFKF